MLHTTNVDQLDQKERAGSIQVSLSNPRPTKITSQKKDTKRIHHSIGPEVSDFSQLRRTYEQEASKRALMARVSSTEKEIFINNLLQTSFESESDETSDESGLLTELHSSHSGCLDSKQTSTSDSPPMHSKGIHDSVFSSPIISKTATNSTYIPMQMVVPVVQTNIEPLTDLDMRPDIPIDSLTNTPHKQNLSPLLNETPNSKKVPSYDPLTVTPVTPLTVTTLGHRAAISQSLRKRSPNSSPEQKKDIVPQDNDHNSLSHDHPVPVDSKVQLPTQVPTESDEYGQFHLPLLPKPSFPSGVSTPTTSTTAAAAASAPYLHPTASDPIALGVDLHSDSDSDLDNVLETIYREGSEDHSTLRRRRTDGLSSSSSFASAPSATILLAQDSTQNQQNGRFFTTKTGVSAYLSQGVLYLYRGFTSACCQRRLVAMPSEVCDLSSDSDQGKGSKKGTKISKQGLPQNKEIVQFREIGVYPPWFPLPSSLHPITLGHELSEKKRIAHQFLRKTAYHTLHQGIIITYRVCHACTDPKVAILAALGCFSFAILLFIPTSVLLFGSLIFMGFAIALVPIAYRVYEHGLLQLLPKQIRALRPFFTDQSLLQLSEHKWSTGVISDLAALVCFDMTPNDRALILARLPLTTQNILQRKLTEFIPTPLASLLLSRSERARLSKKRFRQGGMITLPKKAPLVVGPASGSDVDFHTSASTNTSTSGSKSGSKSDHISKRQVQVQIPTFTTPPRLTTYPLHSNDGADFSQDDVHSTFVENENGEADDSEIADLYGEMDDVIFSPLKLFFSNLEHSMLDDTYEDVIENQKEKEKEKVKAKVKDSSTGHRNGESHPSTPRSHSGFIKDKDVRDQTQTQTQTIANASIPVHVPSTTVVSVTPNSSHTPTHTTFTPTPTVTFNPHLPFFWALSKYLSSKVMDSLFVSIRSSTLQQLEQSQAFATLRYLGLTDCDTFKNYQDSVSSHGNGDVDGTTQRLASSAVSSNRNMWKVFPSRRTVKTFAAILVIFTLFKAYSSNKLRQRMSIWSGKIRKVATFCMDGALLTSAALAATTLITTKCFSGDVASNNSTYSHSHSPVSRSSGEARLHQLPNDDHSGVGGSGSQSVKVHGGDSSPASRALSSLREDTVDLSRDVSGNAGRRTESNSDQTTMNHALSDPEYEYEVALYKVVWELIFQSPPNTFTVRLIQLFVTLKRHRMFKIGLCTGVILVFFLRLYVLQRGTFGNGNGSLKNQTGDRGFQMAGLVPTWVSFRRASQAMKKIQAYALASLKARWVTLKGAPDTFASIFLKK